MMPVLRLGAPLLHFPTTTSESILRGPQTQSSKGHCVRTAQNLPFHCLFVCNSQDTNVLDDISLYFLSLSLERRLQAASIRHINKSLFTKLNVCGRMTAKPLESLDVWPNCPDRTAPTTTTPSPKLQNTIRSLVHTLQTSSPWCLL